MIRYALSCDNAHEFEGWFGSSADFDDQSERGLVGCPVCDSKAVTKQIMAPSIAGTKKTTDLPPQVRSMVMEAMGRVRKHVEDNFDYVGDTFADEARAIHEGRSEDRGIYGEATPAQIKSLTEDGVPIAAMPPAPPKKSEVN
ncbi:MAG: DUF1178 family protein [Phenylobacterium sp.]|uniref:DUF1178 family protein n=1 Tax=Phenylobacterium sp. TaxID=1871053 RepID=UPI0027286DCE|nr:DUF1178 family protein [Phenylobacterium sp.]MDO9433518.1 DUF1178 family protein [Phenylobacterium sp.]